jgi:hypothetical protein
MSVRVSVGARLVGVYRVSGVPEELKVSRGGPIVAQYPGRPPVLGYYKLGVRWRDVGLTEPGSDGLVLGVEPVWKFDEEAAVGSDCLPGGTCQLVWHGRTLSAARCGCRGGSRSTRAPDNQGCD